MTQLGIITAQIIDVNASSDSLELILKETMHIIKHEGMMKLLLEKQATETLSRFFLRGKWKIKFRIAFIAKVGDLNMLTLENGFKANLFLDDQATLDLIGFLQLEIQKRGEREGEIQLIDFSKD